MVLFVISLFGVVGIVPAIRVAYAGASTAGGRLRGVGNVLFLKLGLPVVWGMFALDHAPIHVPAGVAAGVSAGVTVILFLFALLGMAMILADFVPWLRRLPQAIRSTYSRTPPRTN